MAFKVFIFGNVYGDIKFYFCGFVMPFAIQATRCNSHNIFNIYLCLVHAKGNLSQCFANEFVQFHVYPIGG